VNSTIHRDASRFHNHVVIDNLSAGVPRSYFLCGPPQRKGEFFIASLESSIPKFSDNAARLLLSRPTIIDNVIGKLSLREHVFASTENLRK
jgi:hypothetical protein